VVALSVRPAELVAPEISLLLATVARLIATPTPTLAVPPPVADPSALALASTVDDEMSESAPPVEMLTPAGTSALALTSAMFTATAAPTLTLPPEVLALGVAEAPLPPPPLEDWVPVAKLRWLAS
jgi:hypothetical protein